jgi:hypothetical protein
MFPRPLYRWKSFWLGLMGLLFLVWAWLHSVRESAGITWISSTRDRALLIAQSQAHVEIEYFSPPFDSGSLAPGFGGWTDTNRFRADLFPPALESHNKSGNGAGIAIASWLIVVTYLTVVTGILAWRWRRIKQKAASDSVAASSQRQDH